MGLLVRQTRMTKLGTEYRYGSHPIKEEVIIIMSYNHVIVKLQIRMTSPVCTTNSFFFFLMQPVLDVTAVRLKYVKTYRTYLYTIYLTLLNEKMGNAGCLLETCGKS